MQIKVFLALLGVLSAFLLTSCNSEINPLRNKNTIELFPIHQNNKWGFINRQGEVVIQPQFEAALPFSEGLAVACLSREKCGYIDETGKFAINPQFEYAGRFSEGLAAVAGGGKIGYIDKTGKYAINPQFEVMESRAGRLGVLSLNVFSEELAQAKIGEKIGFIDKTGKIIINPQFDNAYPFFDGLAATQIGGKWGFVDKEGKIVINPQFDGTQPFVNGLAAVLIGKQYGYIDKTGKIVINPQFDLGYPFSDEGLARVWTDGKTGFIDKEGKYVVNLQFGSLGPEYLVEVMMVFTLEIQRLSFSEGLTPVKVGDKDAGFIDNTGKFVINPQFNFASPFYGGLALVTFGSESGSDMGWIDKEGKIVWRETKEPPKTISNSSTNSNTQVAVNSNSMSNVAINSSQQSSNSSTSSERTGRLTTDSNMRSEANKDSASLGIHFKDAKVKILDETSYERDGMVSTWYKIRVIEYGCSKDTSLGCGKNSPNDADEGWVNAKVVLLN